MKSILLMISIIPIASCTRGMHCSKISRKITRWNSKINDLTQSSLSIVSYHHHSFVDTSNFYRRLLDKDRNIRCMLCCDADARSAFWMMVVEEQRATITYLLYLAPPFSQAFLFSSSWAIVIFFCRICSGWSGWWCVATRVEARRWQKSVLSANLAVLRSLVSPSWLWITQHSSAMDSIEMDRERTEYRSRWKWSEPFDSCSGFIDCFLGRSN
jgi:hypothetical protein